MPLNPEIIDTLEPESKKYRKSDEKGICLKISPPGTKVWKVAYRFEGGQRSTTFGPYPEISPEEARLLRANAKAGLRAGIDPFLNPTSFRCGSHCEKLGAQSRKSIGIVRLSTATASTNLNEANWNADWIEAQLAHVPRNKVRAACNAAQYVEGLDRMMRWWTDWLDSAEKMD